MKKRNALVVLFLSCIFGVIPCWSFNPCAAEAAAPKVTIEWLIKPQFDNALPFRAGHAWVQEDYDGPYMLIDKNGKAVIKDFQAKYLSYYGTNTDLAAFEDINNGHGYVDALGKVAIPPQFDYTRNFQNGLAVVAQKRDGELFDGVINQNGATVLPMNYKRLVILHHNMFAHKKGEKWGYINEKGEAITDFIFDDVLVGNYFPPNICPVVIDGKIGLINEKGEWVLPASYDQVYQGDEELVALTKDGKVGYVDASGKTVIDFQFIPYHTYRRETNCFTFSEGLAVVPLVDIPPPAMTASSSQPVVTPPEAIMSAVIDKSGNKLFEFRGVPWGKFTDGLLLVAVAKETCGFFDRYGNYYPLPSDINSNIKGFGLFTNRAHSDGTLLVRMKPTKPFEHGKYGYLKISVK